MQKLCANQNGSVNYNVSQKQQHVNVLATQTSKAMCTLLLQIFFADPQVSIILKKKTNFSFFIQWNNDLPNVHTHSRYSHIPGPVSSHWSQFIQASKQRCIAWDAMPT